jgi:hypothetical protein
MLRCYVDDEQLNWDVHLRALCFAYNSTVHDTTKYCTIEVMTGRKPKVPLDLVFPVVDVWKRDPILQCYDLMDNRGRITVSDDIQQAEVTNMNSHVVAKEYVTFIREKSAKLYRTVCNHRDIRMTKAALRHDRNIKRDSYEVGDLVLCDHPKIAKGVARGLARK